MKHYSVDGGYFLATPRDDRAGSQPGSDGRSSDGMPTAGAADGLHFELLREPCDGLAAAWTGRRWGYLDERGRIAVEPRFDRAEDFAGGLALVRVGRAWGVIDRRGAYLRRPELEAPPHVVIDREAACGRIRVLAGDAYGFLDAARMVSIEATLEWAGRFHEDRACVAIGGHRGFVDPDGVLVIDAIYDGAEPFVAGKARVLLDGHWSHVDRDGRACSPPAVDEDAFGQMRLV